MSTLSTTLNDDVVKSIKSLISICRDGEYGFKTAADGLENDPELKAEFLAYSRQRGEFANRWHQDLEAHGVPMGDSGSIIGDLHRGWINLRQAIAGNERAAIVGECIRGEDAALKEFRDAEVEGMTSSLRSILTSQMNEIEVIHKRLERLYEGETGKKA